MVAFGREEWAETALAPEKRGPTPVGRTGAVLYTAGGCLQNILDKIFRKKDAKIFGSSEIVAIFAIPFGKQANT